jgi:polar amino acid transport system substrate-binding protein
MTLHRLLHACACLLLAGAALLRPGPASAVEAELHGYTEPLPPLDYERDGQPRGFSVELLQALARRAGLGVDIAVLPWPRAVILAAQDTRSVLFTLTRTEEREHQYKWVGPIARRRIVLYRLADRQDVTVNALDDLHHLRVGVARESATARQLAQQGFAASLEVAANDDATMRMLIAHHVDAIAMLDFAAAWHSSRQGSDFAALHPLITLDDSHEYYFGLHKDAPDALVASLQHALDELRRDGELERLTQRYLQ